MILYTFVKVVTNVKFGGCVLFEPSQVRFHAAHMGGRLTGALRIQHIRFFLTS